MDDIKGPYIMDLGTTPSNEETIRVAVVSFENTSKSDNRPDRQVRFMMRAELESLWSTCSRLAVGTCVWDMKGNILLTAYNGAPRKQKHCNRQPVQDGRCVYCVHSEKNAINHAANRGIQLEGAWMSTLYRPCVSCANDIVQAGIAGVIYRHDYDTDGMKDHVYNTLDSSGIVLYKQGITKQEISFSKMLNDWKNTWIVDGGLQGK